jgi:hypothetical protein
MKFTNIKQCRSAESVDWGLSMLGKRDFYLKKISNCCNQNEKAQKNIKNGKMVQLALCYLVKKRNKAIRHPI